MADSTLSILVQLQDQASQQLSRLGDSLKGVQSSMQPAITASQQFAVGLLALGAAAGAFAYTTIQAAGQAQVKIASLTATLQTMGEKGTDAEGQILALGTASVKLGFNAEDVALSISKLYQRTGDLTEATRLNSIAMDLARAKHLDLVSASNLVGLVMSGNGRILKQYGIDLKSAGSPLEALNELQGKLAGQASAFSKTFQGQSEVMKESFNELKVSVGNQLLPAVTALLVQVTMFATTVLPVWIENAKEVAVWLENHRVVLYAIAGAIAGALAPAMIAFVTVTIPALITAFAAAAIALAPWMIGGLIIGAIVAGIMWIINNWQLVKTEAVAIWTSIKDFLKNNLDLILLVFTGGIGNIVKLVVDNWQAIQDTTKEIWQGIGSVISDVWADIENTVKASINWILEKINSVITAVNNAVHSVGSKIGLNIPAIPTIPLLAQGGIVTRPTLAMVGEGGEPEAVIPLSRLNQFAGGTGGITIHINGPVMTGPEYAREMGNQLAMQIKRQIRI
jgi:hypothetical protein